MAQAVGIVWTGVVGVRATTAMRMIATTKDNASFGFTIQSPFISLSLFRPILPLRIQSLQVQLGVAVQSDSPCVRIEKPIQVGSTAQL